MHPPCFLSPPGMQGRPAQTSPRSAVLCLRCPNPLMPSAPIPRSASHSRHPDTAHSCFEGHAILLGWRGEWAPGAEVRLLCGACRPRPGSSWSWREELGGSLWDHSPVGKNTSPLRDGGRWRRGEAQLSERTGWAVETGRGLGSSLEARLELCGGSSGATAGRWQGEGPRPMWLQPGGVQCRCVHCTTK